MRTDAGLLNVAAESASVTPAGQGPGCELLMLEGVRDGRVIRSATRRRITFRPPCIYAVSCKRTRQFISNNKTVKS